MTFFLVTKIQREMEQNHRYIKAIDSILIFEIGIVLCCTSFVKIKQVISAKLTTTEIQKKKAKDMKRAKFLCIVCF